MPFNPDVLRKACDDYDWLHDHRVTPVALMALEDLLARLAELELRLAQFERGEGAGESERATICNSLNLVTAERNRYHEALVLLREQSGITFHQRVIINAALKG